MNYSIIVENLSKQIKKQILLKDVSFKVRRGETVGLVGRNGSGKTVLLKLICGLYIPSSGKITINGKVLGKDDEFPEKTGFIIETPGFIPSLSGYDNLKILASIKGTAGKEAVRKAISFVGLDPDNKKHVGKYSLGMRQRLGVAQAIMENPDILVLDEPFNGLDKEGCEEMRRYLLGLKSQGKTIIIASHLEADIELLCDEVYQMDSGMITGISCKKDIVNS